MSRDGRVWLNQKQMAELFAVSKPNVSMLISKILKEKELDDSVVKCYLTTASDGKKYKVIYSKRRHVLLTRPIWQSSEGLKKRLKGEDELVAKEREA